MSEQAADNVGKLLACLHVDAERVWRSRPCLSLARLWKIALESGTLASGEQRHLAACANCQQRDKEVRGLLQPATGETSARSPALDRPKRVAKADRPEADKQ